MEALERRILAGLGIADLLQLAKDQGIRTADDKVGRVVETVRRWPEFANAAGLSDARSGMLAAEMPASRW